MQGADKTEIVRKNLFGFLMLSMIVLAFISLMLLTSHSQIGLQYVNSFFTGIVLGLGFIFLQWPSYDRFSRRDIGVSAEDIERLRHNPQKEANRQNLPFIVAGGIIFYILGFISKGFLFGVAFGSGNFPQSGIEQFTNDALILTTITGIFWGLILRMIGIFFDVGFLRKDLKGFGLAIIVYSMGLFWSVALSILFFSNSVLFVVSIISRTVGIMLLAQFEPRGWEIASRSLLLLAFAIVPLMAFLAGEWI